MAILKHKTIKLPTFKLLLDGLNDLQLLSTDNNLFEDCFVNTVISNCEFMVSFTKNEGDMVRLIAKQSRPIGKKLVNPEIEIRVYNHAINTSFNHTPKDLDNVPSFINSEYKPMRMLRDFLQLVLSEHCRIVKLKDKETTEEELVRLRAENEALSNTLQQLMDVVKLYQSIMTTQPNVPSKDQTHYTEALLALEKGLANLPDGAKSELIKQRLEECLKNLNEDNHE